MRYITSEQLLLIHHMLVDTIGGSHGVRDHDRVKAIIEAPKQEVLGKVLYPTVHIKAAVYLHDLIKYHPFIDGNKRTAVTTASVFLENNGYKISAERGELAAFALSVIKRNLTIKQIASWFKNHSQQIKS